MAHSHAHVDVLAVGRRGDMALVGIGGNVGMGTEGADRRWVWALWLHGTDLEPMRSAPGSDGITATGKDETAVARMERADESERTEM